MVARNRAKRDRMIRELIAEGKTAREISKALGIFETDAIALKELAAWSDVREREFTQKPEPAAPAAYRVRKTYYNPHKPEIMEVNPFNVVSMC